MVRNRSPTPQHDMLRNRSLKTLNVMVPNRSPKALNIVVRNRSPKTRNVTVRNQQRRPRLRPHVRVATPHDPPVPSRSIPLWSQSPKTLKPER
eukprot:1783127-Pyramimonas_sp.AAC.2